MFSRIAQPLHLSKASRPSSCSAKETILPPPPPSIQNTRDSIKISSTKGLSQSEMTTSKKPQPTTQRKARKKRFSQETDLDHTHNKRLQCNVHAMEVNRRDPSNCLEQRNLCSSQQIMESRFINNEKGFSKKRSRSLISELESDLSRATLMHSHQEGNVGAGQPKVKRRRRRFAITPDGIVPKWTESKSPCESSEKCRDLSIYDSLNSYTFPQNSCTHNE